MSALPVSIDANNEPTVSVLRRLAKVGGVQIVLSDAVRGRTTIALHDVTIGYALRRILVPLHLTFRTQGGAYVIQPATDETKLDTTTSASSIAFQVIAAGHAASVLRRVFPKATIAVDKSTNSIVVRASPDDLNSIRSIAQTLDIKNPTDPVTEIEPVRTIDAKAAVQTLESLFPKSGFSIASQRSILVRATPQDMTQIRLLLSGLDALPASAAKPMAFETVKIVHRSPKDIARAISLEAKYVRVAVAGAAVVLTGAPEDVAKARSLAVSLDLPPFNARYAQVYKIRTIDATSLADLLAKGFPTATIAADKALNVITVAATSDEQQRIADAIAQLDGNAASSPGGTAAPGAGGGNFEIVTLRSAVPSATGGAQQSTTDMATALNQAMQTLAPDLKISSLPNTGQIVLMGSQYSIGIGKNFLKALDIPQPLVVLDTVIMEMDVQTARNLGLELPQPIIATTFSELTPPLNANGQFQIQRLQTITRTPLSLTAELNLLIQDGTAQVLADPRITTLSGHTASIRAGDTIGILTTTGGGVGTIVTQQLQTFQTGVNLDITPIVDAEGGVTVALHPVVNSLSGILNGVPEISTRDTQTTVRLLDNQTLVIGGLIQEQDSKTVNKVPVLGDVPLVGGLFKNNNVSNTRNELVIVVTPHILKDGEQAAPMGSKIPNVPTPRPLPTLPAGTILPLIRSVASTAPAAAAARALAPPAEVKPSPGPTPAAFGATNTFTFGQAPANNFARATDAVQIFYVSFAPTVLSNNVPVNVAIVTTTNVAKLTVGPVGGSNAVQLTQTAPGQWQGSYKFNTIGLDGQQSTQLLVTASRADNIASTVRIPISIAQ
ncbi:MAG: secretin N-terminal domain-containing protein [Vulcanimicrobiaceae bacterium]|jgi:type II secretory pathway component GspD/PulD (secretin)